jgi:protein-disulfide isomerase
MRMAQKKQTSADQKQAAAAKREARRAKAERAKAAAAAKKAAEQRRQRLVVGGVVLAIIVVIVGGFFIFRSTNDTSATSGPPEGLTSESGLLVGEEGAPRSVVIYEDFLCPACGALEGSVNEQLSAAAEQGDVSVEYRPVSILGRISDYSMRSANAFAVVLDTSGPEVAKQFHDILYADQPSESGPFPEDDELVEKAVEAGAEESEVRPGIEDLAFEGWVEDATDAFSRAGHTGTPTVLIDGEPAQGQTMQEIAQAVLDAAAG